MQRNWNSETTWEKKNKVRTEDSYFQDLLCSYDWWDRVIVGSEPTSRSMGMSCLCRNRSSHVSVNSDFQMRYHRHNDLHNRNLFSTVPQSKTREQAGSYCGLYSSYAYSCCLAMYSHVLQWGESSLAFLTLCTRTVSNQIKEPIHVI